MIPGCVARKKRGLGDSSFAVHDAYPKERRKWVDGNGGRARRLLRRCACGLGSLGLGWRGEYGENGGREGSTPKPSVHALYLAAPSRIHLGIATIRSSPAAPALDAKKEDAAVKSIRRLLWVLWVLAWPLVPNRVLEVVMFGSLAALIVLSWHKGALLRLLVRDALARIAARRVPSVESALPITSGARGLRLAEAPAPNVRVSVHPMRVEDAMARTERSTVADDPKRRARLRS